jgi:hypothetical protein
MTIERFARWGALGLTTIFMLGTPAVAAPNPAKPSIKCRGVIAKKRQRNRQGRPEYDRCVSQGAQQGQGGS